MNSDKRMAELYLERAAGKKHLFLNSYSEWQYVANEVFYKNLEYKLTPETLDEFISYIDVVGAGQWEDDMRAMAKWAWANPESKE